MGPVPVDTSAGACQDQHADVAAVGVRAAGTDQGSVNSRSTTST
ncbi:hypothetical protein [Streptomyces sp. SID13726]|nr:hypothetical protein [Streptomyces sp. SID13726]